MTVLSTVPTGVPTAVPTGTPAVVEVVGDLDHTTAARVRVRLEQALDASPDHLVVDLSRCPFVDASALAMLLDLHRRAVRSGGALSLRGCSPRVLRLLSLTGLRRVFPLQDAAPARPGSA